MAFPTKAVAVLAALAGGAALLGGGGGKKTTTKKRRPNQGGPKEIQLPAQMPAWCKELHKGTVSQERRQQLTDAVIVEHGTREPWDGHSLNDARQLAFEITMAVMATLCPGVELPSTQQALPNYLEQKPAWWKALYIRIHAEAWHLATGSA